MIKYILQRIWAMALTLFVIMVLSFIIIRLMPMSIFEDPDIPPEVAVKLEEEMHLHDPIPMQLFYYLKNIILDFNFGTSVKIKPGAPVFSVIRDAIPPTVGLNILSLFISIPLGLIAGFLAALMRNTWVDTVISFSVVMCISIPSFVFASLLQYTLTFVFPIFPTLYDATGGLSVQLYSMILPIVALALNPIATIARYLRGELIENISSEYLLLARTKGLTRAQATIRHAFRNSMMPITSTLVSLITGVMGGSLVIEKMFSVPGMGGKLIDSIMAGDHFLTVAVLIFYAIISLVTILIVDLAYGVIDPRVRIGGGSK